MTSRSLRASALVVVPAVLSAMWFAPMAPAGAAVATVSCVAGFQDNGGGICLRNFGYSGAPVAVTLPGVGVLHASVAGGQGGDSREEGDIVQSSLGGKGGREVAMLPVVPGEPLTVLVGRAGADGGLQTYGGGYGGGGNPDSNYGGGGGGGSFVFDSDGVLIAAGGGGGGGYDPNPTYTGGQIQNSLAPGGAGSGSLPATDGQSVAFCCDSQLTPAPPGGGLGATPTGPGLGGTAQGYVPPSFGAVDGESGWGPATGPAVLGKGGDTYHDGAWPLVGWAGGGGGGYYGGGGGGTIDAWLEGGGGGGAAGTVDPGAWADSAAVGTQVNGGAITLSYSRTQPAAPTINSIFPRIGAPGHDLTINGSNLTGATTVRFGGVLASSFSVLSPTQILATIPADAIDGRVVVTTHGGKARSPSPFSLRHILPDALIRAPGAATDAGEEIYNTTALHQTARASAMASSTVVFRITVQNDGDETDSILIHGPARTGSFGVRYLAGTAGATVVTGAVRAGTYALADIAPGATGVIRLEISVDRGTLPGAAADRVVTVTSATDSGLRDAVKAHVTVIRS